MEKRYTMGTLIKRYVGAYIGVKIDIRKREIIRDKEVHYIICVN